VEGWINMNVNIGDIIEAIDVSITTLNIFSLGSDAVNEKKRQVSFMALGMNVEASIDTGGYKFN